jgi:DNA-binding NtrC family response regulator
MGARGPTPVAAVEELWGPHPEPGASAPRRVLVPGRPLVVGRQPGAGLQLRDGHASRKHATFTLAADEASVGLVDSSAHGTMVNGEAVAGATTLADGDVIRMGDSFLLLRFIPPEDRDPPVEGLLGRAPSMRALRRVIHLVAPTDATVLLLGEPGTGKELVARSLHALSGRPGPFVAVHCAAIPEHLAESQLFGHVAGAFTGARTASEGSFRAAEGGTLLLDEIGELPPPLQPKLLRAIEERAVVPVGATRPIPCDLRLVAATHRALGEDVAQGAFRGDLFARLAEITLPTPPLRKRREDILPLLTRALGRDAGDLDPDLVDALLTHPWPFNVRELLEVGEELAIRGQGQERLSRSLVAERFAPSPSEAAAPTTTPAPRPEREPPSRETLEALLRGGGGNVSFVARETGWSRRHIDRLLAQHGLDATDYR